MGYPEYVAVHISLALLISHYLWDTFREEWKGVVQAIRIPLSVRNCTSSGFPSSSKERRRILSRANGSSGDMLNTTRSTLLAWTTSTVSVHQFGFFGPSRQLVETGEMEWMIAPGQRDHPSPRPIWQAGACCIPSGAAGATQFACQPDSSKIRKYWRPINDDDESDHEPGRAALYVECSPRVASPQELRAFVARAI
jgi:hypothetical protein